MFQIMPPSHKIYLCEIIPSNLVIFSERCLSLRNFMPKKKKKRNFMPCYMIYNMLYDLLDLDYWYSNPKVLFSVL